MIKITKIDHVALTVRNLKRSARFYKGILGFRMLGKPDDHVFIKAGEVELALFQVKNPKKAKGLGGWRNIGVQHVAFTVGKRKFEKAQTFLKRKRIKWEGPVDHGTALSIYFKDPDSNTFELTYNK